MWNKVLPHLTAIVVFLALSITYFYPQFNGMVMPKGDLIQWRGMVHEMKQYETQTGRDVLWTNSMFGGMPTYQIDSIRKGNGLTLVEKIARLGIPSPAGHFFLAMLSFFVMLVVLKVDPWLSIIGAVAFGLTTNSLTIYEAGHISKFMALLYLPLVVAGMILAFRRQYLLGGAIFALGTGLNLWASHPQMSYYFVLTTVFFGIAELIEAVRKKEVVHFSKAAGALAVGGLLALGSTASNILPTLEYAEDTMRGKPILEAEGQIDPNSSSQTEGLAWNYAMRWSNGVLDLFSSFIPGVAGGSSNEPVSQDSEIVQDLTRQGYRVPDPLALPLYWGALPFTSGPIYFGAVIFLFFLMGLTLVKGPVKWWLALGTLFTLMLSMGMHLEWFNRFIFEYVPLYNKFRTPNSVLGVTSVLVPALALLAVSNIVQQKVSGKEILNSLYVSGGILAAICLFFIVMGPSSFSFTHPSDAQNAGALKPEMLITARKNLMQADALRSLLLIALSGAGVWAFVQHKLEKRWLVLALGALTLFDMWGVGRRYINSNSFMPKSAFEANFTPRPADTQILQDPDPSFRVWDVSVGSPFESTKASYYHKSIGGYHAAKLQRYQDIIDRYLMAGNPGVMNMLNTRYIIQRSPEGQEIAQRNPDALGNAWFVDTIRMAASANEEIDALGEIDPGQVAVVHQEFAGYVAGLNPTPDGSIALTEYTPDKLTYQSNTSSEQLAVFSEIWYGPDKGWKAYIDDQPVEHIRADYLLRAMKVPAGQHTITFEFAPAVYKAGVAISIISSLIIILGVLGIAGYSAYHFWQRVKNEPVAEAPALPQKKVGKTVARTKKRGGR